MTLDHDLAPWRNVGSRPRALPGVGAYRVGPWVTVRSLRKNGLGRGERGVVEVRGCEVRGNEGNRRRCGGRGRGEGGKEMEGGSHRGFRWRVHVRVRDVDRWTS